MRRPRLRHLAIAVLLAAGTVRCSDNGPGEPTTATRIEMRAVFPTKAQRDEAVEKYHAIEGGQQTLGHLADYVAEMVRKGAAS